MKISKWVILIISMILYSCECAYDYSYEIENQTDGVIQVNWTHNTVSQSKSIEPGSSEIFLITGHGIEPCRTGPFFQDVKIDLQKIEIINSENLKSKLNYQENDLWEYSGGHFKAFITNDEF